MKADLKAFRDDVEESLRKVLDDPRHAPWLADHVVALIERLLAGLTIPSRKAKALEALEKQAAELIHLGADKVAERQGCHRSTAYRRAAKYKRDHAA